jgi:ElaB/YqjD/DUF883 family membrane-anchored ribosome-binding protein
MKPAYWIGILAFVGALIGYAISRRTGWYGAGIGAILGILVGTLIYHN